MRFPHHKGTARLYSTWMWWEAVTRGRIPQCDWEWGLDRADYDKGEE